MLENNRRALSNSHGIIYIPRAGRYACDDQNSALVVNLCQALGNKIRELDNINAGASGGGRNPLSRQRARPPLYSKNTHFISKTHLHSITHKFLTPHTGCASLSCSLSAAARRTLRNSDGPEIYRLAVCH